MRQHTLRTVVGLLSALTLLVAACTADTTDETAPYSMVTEVPRAPYRVVTDVPLPPTATALQASVDSYLRGIPEDFMVIGDIAALKEALDGGAVLVDVRDVEEYQEGHLPGAINIPLRTLTDNLDRIPVDRQVITYCASGHRASMAVSALRILGYENVYSFRPSLNGWVAAGGALTTAVPYEFRPALAAPMPEMPLTAVDRYLARIPEGFQSAGSVDQVKAAIEAGAWLLDVRSDAEWVGASIPGAHHIALAQLASRLGQIPTDQPIVVYCGTGHRAALAAAALGVLGYDDVWAFPGGLSAWSEAGERMVTH